MSDGSPTAILEVRATWRRFLIVLLWTVVLLAGAAVFVALENPTQAAAAVVVIAVGWWYGMRYTIPGRLLVSIDGAGITDRATALAVGFVPWSEVVGTTIVGEGRRAALLVHLADAESARARRRRFARLLARRDRSMTEADIWLPLSDYVSLDELAGTIKPWIRDRRP